MIPTAFDGIYLDFESDLPSNVHIDMGVILAEDPDWQTRVSKSYGRKERRQVPHAPQRVRGAAFVLWHSFGWHPKTIAEFFGISERTVSKWKTRSCWDIVKEQMEEAGMSDEELAPTRDVLDVAARLAQVQSYRSIEKAAKNQIKNGNGVASSLTKAITEDIEANRLWKNKKLKQARSRQDALEAKRVADSKPDSAKTLHEDLVNTDLIDKISERGAGSSNVPNLNQQINNYLNFDAGGDVVEISEADVEEDAGGYDEEE